MREMRDVEEERKKSRTDDAGKKARGMLSSSERREKKPGLEISHSQKRAGAELYDLIGTRRPEKRVEI